MDSGNAGAMGETGRGRGPLFGIVLVLAAMAGAALYVWLGTESYPGQSEMKKAFYSLEKGEPELSITQFRAALMKNPSLPAAHLGIAMASLRMDRAADAMAELDTAIAMKPDFAEAYANRGIVRDRLGMYAGALGDYTKAIGLDPNLAGRPGFSWRSADRADEIRGTLGQRADYIASGLSDEKRKKGE